MNKTEYNYICSPLLLCDTYRYLMANGYTCIFTRCAVNITILYKVVCRIVFPFKISIRSSKLRKNLSRTSISSQLQIFCNCRHVCKKKIIQKFIELFDWKRTEHKFIQCRQSKSLGRLSMGLILMLQKNQNCEKKKILQ